MDGKKIYSVVGGDSRQLACIYLLANEGNKVKVLGFSDIESKNVEVYKDITPQLFSCDILLLPIPYRNKDVYINFKYMDLSITPDEIIKNIKPSTLVILGKPDEYFVKLADEKGIRYYDILKEEAFSILNAIPTAEGAIQKAMEKSDITLHGARVLVLGYGRIGKSLSRMLKGIGAEVTVEARKSKDLAWIIENGYKAVHLDKLDEVIGSQQIIFNTVPHMILDKRRLMKISKSTLIIDLASYPGGTDFSAAKELGIQASLELGLPGIVAPKTAGKIIYDVVKDMEKRYISS